MTTTNLFQRVKQGDKAAFDELFLLYYKELCRFSFTFLHHFDDSEEVVQKIFVRLWENRKTIIQPENTKSYLYKSVYYECLKYLKSQSVREKYHQNYFQYKWDLQEETNETESLLPYLNKAIEKLPEKCRQIFILNKMEGMKQKEIAEILNISTKTVENQIAIAVTKLRTELKPVLHLLPSGILFMDVLFKTFR